MPKKVLYVDDEPFFVLSLVEALQDEGYVVEKAMNSSDAIDKIDRFEYDLIILDIIMPTANDGEKKGNGMRQGLLAHTIIREKGIMTPIIFVTVVEDQEAYSEIRKLEKKFGLEACILTKPVFPSELLENIKVLIGGP